MNKEEILATIAAEILKQDVTLSIKEITPDKSLTADLGMDSLDTVELAMEMEKRYKIQIGDEEMESIHTVGELADAICRHVK